MTVEPTLTDSVQNPQELEQRFQELTTAEETRLFTANIEAAYSAEPHNLLLAAWHYRLQHANIAPEMRTPINWLAAIPLAILLALAFWLMILNNPLYLNTVPPLFLLWAPLTAVAVIAFAAWTSQHSPVSIPWPRVGIAIGALALLTLIAYFSAARFTDPDHYLQQSALHLPLLAWAATGFAVLGLRTPAIERFSFLTKSLHAAVVGGIFVIVFFMFGGLTLMMFDVLGVLLPDAIQFLLFAGGGGLVPVLAVALVYDPTRRPSEQEFDQGLGRILSMLFRLLLPLTLIVLVAYVVAILFNFQGAFENRDTLIVYNLVQFAVIGLLMAASPISAETLSPHARSLIQNSIRAIATLTLVISLYALAAILSRTATGSLTANRFTFIGWNLINIAFLATLLWGQLRTKENWLTPIHQTYSQFTLFYALWAAATLILVPLFFS